MHKSNKRIAAAVVALALGFSTAGAGVFAPVAGAQIESTIIDDINEIQPTLTIEKYIGMPVGGPGAYDNEIQDELDKLAKGYGAQFKIERLDIDLTTVEGWEAVRDLTPSTLNAAATDSDFSDQIVTTGAEGTPNAGTVKVDLPVGVYRVTETGAPTNTDNVTYQQAAPFFVTLPFTDPATGEWNYNQTVRPKNQAAVEIDKDVEDRSVTADQKISYTISAPVPAGNLTQLIITDTLPNSLTGATNVKVKAGTSVDDAVELSEGSVKSITEPVQDLVVELTTEGLAELQTLRAANDGLKIFVTFDTTVSSVPAEGVIKNDASIDLGGKLKYNTEDNGNTVETHLGSLTINKVKSDTKTIITEGTAKFDLYRCNSDGADQARFTTVGDPLLEGLTTEDGTVTRQNVQSWSHVSGDAPTPAIGEFLCVVETHAPKNYTLNPEPQKVDFTAAVDDHFDMVVNVVNLHTNDEAGGGQLPSTGGQGTMALIAAGVLVAAAGGAASVRANRARR